MKAKRAGGWTAKEASVRACLAYSYDALEKADEKRMARALASFPAEKVVPLGALQRACGHADRNRTKMIVAELLSKSIVSGLEDGHLVSVHGLMHEVLLALQTQGEEETGATGSIGGESKSSPAHPPVGPALAYFEAFHLVGSSARGTRWEAKETYAKSWEARRRL